ncbi:cytochrome c3 family protein, partial [Acinetobacter baumannii]|uniref:cytochrome c3 family protein n=1 Tax=Acinetobacter baumannii TaxID=470 RepID=UPI003392ED8F
VIWDSRPGITIPALSVTRLAGQSFVFAVEPAADGKGLVAKQKPVALCGSCHDNVADDLKKAVVHAAFQGGSCASCHDAHGSKNAALAKSVDGTMCLACHKQIAEKASA